MCRQLSRSTSSLTIIPIPEIQKAIPISIYRMAQAHTHDHSPYGGPKPKPKPKPKSIHIYACLISPPSSRIMNLLLNKSQTHHTPHTTCTFHFLIMHSLSINFFYDDAAPTCPPGHIYPITVPSSLTSHQTHEFHTFSFCRASRVSINDKRSTISIVFRMITQMIHIENTQHV